MNEPVPGNSSQLAAQERRNIKANLLQIYDAYISNLTHTPTISKPKKKRGRRRRRRRRRMYVTRPLSQLLKSPELMEAAPEGPNSGFLVIQDEESLRYSCFGMCKNPSLKQLPFPQDKELTVQYSTYMLDRYHVSLDPLFLIPALNHPLSSNRYYAIVPHRKRIGEALTCSREEDKAGCCFCRCVKDVKSRPLDPRNAYQQVNILPYDGVCKPAGYFRAKSVAPDGFPPSFLRRKGWTIHTDTPSNFKLDDVAHGLDSGLRSRLPELGSPGSRVVGKWYTPFVFVKEWSLREQVKKSMYYEVTLEQRWEQIFKTNNYVDNNKGKKVLIEAVIEKEQAFVGGRKATWEEKDGVIWFKPIGGGGGEGVGLRVEVVERMKWEQQRGGWMGGEEREVTIKKVEEFVGGGNWNEFGCFVLVETFNLKRMDGSLVMSYDFKHLNQLRTKWD